MTTQEIEHVKGCKEMLQECAARAGWTVLLTEYRHGLKDNIPAIDIELVDKDGCLVRRIFGDVGQAIGFIHGYLYALKKGAV